MEINNTQKPAQFSSAMFFEIELLSGESSSVITIYNNKEVDFEEILNHMQNALQNCRKIKSVKPSIGSIKKGKYEPILMYSKIEFDRTESLNNTFIRKDFFSI